MDTLRLDEAFSGIITAYNSMLTDATAEDGLLADVETIIRADQSRPIPKPPSIWIFPHASIQNQSMSIKESWELPVQLVAIVKENDPIIGYNEAFRLSALARSVILQNRNLSLPYVRDTISKSFEPTTPPKGKSKNLHSHSSLLITRFEVMEY
jgi:hypothetical protein